MEAQPIYFFPDDDIISIKDQVIRAERDRILLIVPNRFSNRLSRIDLVLIKRSAQKSNKELAIVTGGIKLRSLAHSLFIPTFRSEEEAKAEQRGWRVGRRPVSVVGVNQRELDEISLHFERRANLVRKRMGKPDWTVWLSRYGIILAIFIISALTFVGIVYTIPGATVRLQPESNEIRVSRAVTADINQSETSFTEAIIPARLISVTVSWQTEMRPTGSVETANVLSRGRVLFTNNLDQVVVIPAGTVVRSNGAGSPAFQTVSTVTAPGIIGGSVEVGIVALQAGPIGNVPAGSIQTIEDSLAIQLTVSNPVETAGGAAEPVLGVSQADVEQIRAEVQGVIETVAQSRFESRLRQNEFIAVESVKIDSMLSETFSHSLGQAADVFSLRSEAIVTGIAINPIPGNDIVYTELIRSIDPDVVLNPSSFRFQTPRVVAVEEPGLVRLEMVATGVVSPKLELDHLLDDVAGQEINAAMSYLDAVLPLATEPSARVVPNWFDRLPYLATRIEPVIELSD